MINTIIAAPYYRCGSTLIQRCLHACENTFIYGEMNSLPASLLNLYNILLVNKRNDKEEKLDKWLKKEDDDFSGVINTDAIKSSIYAILSYLFPPDRNNGFKIIGANIDEINVFLNFGFNIIYVKRNMQDAFISYAQQKWAHPSGFYTAYNKSYNVETNLEKIKEKAKSKIFIIDYNDIHTKIHDIITDLGLSIQQDVLNKILQTKINSGYTQEKVKDDNIHGTNIEKA